MTDLDGEVEEYRQFLPVVLPAFDCITVFAAPFGFKGIQGSLCSLAGKSGDGSGEPIAKGNVLVFETYYSRNRKQKLSVVEKRNTPDSKLSSQENRIFKMNNKRMETANNETQFSYPEPDKPEFVSGNFKSPAFYEASKVEPFTFQGFTEFTRGGFKSGPWTHLTIKNGKDR